MCSSINSTTEKTKKKKKRFVLFLPNYPKMLQILSKTPKRVCRRHIKHGIILNKESYLSVCVCWTVCLRDPFLLWSLSACAASNLAFFLWKKRLPQTSSNEEEKKGKSGLNRKWWRSCMEIILEPKLEPREPVTTSTLVQTDCEKLLKFGLFQSC